MIANLSGAADLIHETILSFPAFLCTFLSQWSEWIGGILKTNYYVTKSIELQVLKVKLKLCVQIYIFSWFSMLDFANLII